MAAISVAAVALHSAPRCKERLDSIIDSPRSLQIARKDVVAYHDILSSIKTFTREHNPTPIMGAKLLGMKKTG